MQSETAMCKLLIYQTVFVWHSASSALFLAAKYKHCMLYTYSRHKHKKLPKSPNVKHQGKQACETASTLCITTTTD